jgi:uncharacterized protein YndB with AHSA1/START domain
MQSIREEVVVAASPDILWHAWTISDRVAKWFAPAANVDARIGGAYEVFFDPTDHSRMSTKGCKVTAMEPHRHLAFTWKGPDHVAAIMNDESRLTVVRVTLSPEGDGTRVVVEHTGWGEGEEWAKAREWHVMAWKQVTGSLKSALESGQGDLCCQPA